MHNNRLNSNWLSLSYHPRNFWTNSKIYISFTWKCYDCKWTYKKLDYCFWQVDKSWRWSS